MSHQPVPLPDQDTAIGFIHEVGRFAGQVAKHGLPGRRAQSVRAVLDTVGNMALGAAQPIHDVVVAVARQWGVLDAATAIGHPERLPAASAAFLNGTFAHCMDFDDTHLPSVLHPSSSVVPAALAAAEQAGASGPLLLDAIAVGTEVCIRLGMAGYDEENANSVFFDRGQHATSICGAIGSAVAASMLMSGDAGSIAAAGGIAASMAAGLIEANRTGGSVKRIHTGWAAHCGISAACLAEAGLTGPPTVLEGRFGFFRAFCGDQARPEVVTADLGRCWHSAALHIKPYPCNHFTHTAIDAALQLRKRGVRPEEIIALELGVAEAALKTIAEPAALKAAPENGYAAAFSGPYTVAAALVGGGGLGVYVNDFSDVAIRRPQALEVAAKVSCYADPECTAIFPQQFAARLTARLTGERTEEIACHVNRGGPYQPLTEEELELKFTLNAAHLWSADAVRSLREEIARLPDAVSVAPLTELLRAR